MMGHVTILGAGTRFEMRGSHYYDQVLTSADVIYTIIKEPPAVWAPATLDLNKVIPLHSLYMPGRPRAPIYAEMAHRVMNSARSMDHIVYITYGSPVVFDSVVTSIRASCLQNGIHCKVYPGVNSIDSVLAFIGESMEPGIQIYEARWFMLQGVEPHARTKLLLTQLAAFGSDDVVSLEMTDPSNMGTLGQYLLTWYGPDHEVVFVRSSEQPGDPGYYRVELIGQMSRALRSDVLGTCLFVPELSDSRTAVVDWQRRTLYV